MRFSIITICYNPGPELKTAMESVLAQQDASIEYILVDGGSTDGTVERIKSYGNRISTFVSEPDKGLYDALNKGVKLATGDVIGFVHADDLYPSNDVLATLAEAFAAGADAVYGDLEYVDRADTARVIRYWKSGPYHPSRLKYGWMPPHPTLFLKREFYEQARLPNGQYFDTSFTCAADYDFMMRLLSQQTISVAYLPAVLVKMRVGGVSNRSLKHMIRKSREDYFAMKRNHIGGLGTLIAKNLSKLPQLLARYNPIEVKARQVSHYRSSKSRISSSE